MLDPPSVLESVMSVRPSEFVIIFSTVPGFRARFFLSGSTFWCVCHPLNCLYELLGQQLWSKTTFHHAAVELITSSLVLLLSRFIRIKIYIDTLIYRIRVHTLNFCTPPPSNVTNTSNNRISSTQYLFGPKFRKNMCIGLRLFFSRGPFWNFFDGLFI